jgi:hypothetical protein
MQVAGHTMYHCMYCTCNDLHGYMQSLLCLYNMHACDFVSSNITQWIMAWLSQLLSVWHPCTGNHLFSAAARAIYTGFANGVGEIWLDNVECTGRETRIIDCPANVLGDNNCDHSEDAGVRCVVVTVTCPQGAIRLLGGSTTTEGRVEICNMNIWGTVCDDFWEARDARIACAQLGLPTTGEFRP